MRGSKRRTSTPPLYIESQETGHTDHITVHVSQRSTPPMHAYAHAGWDAQLAVKAAATSAEAEAAASTTTAEVEAAAAAAAEAEDAKIVEAEAIA